MSGDENADEPKERNSYKSTLEYCRDTLVPGCRDNVHTGSGTPADAIAGPIAAGGWECTEADTWTTELTTHCSGILDAFNDAIDVIRKETGGQPEYVPARDWRGNTWPKQWQMEQRMF